MRASAFYLCRRFWRLAVGADRLGLSDDEECALLVPIHRQVGVPDQCLGGEIGGLGSSEDRCDDVGGQKGQAQLLCNVSPANLMRCGNLADGSHSAAGQIVKPSDGPRHSLNEDRIVSCVIGRAGPAKNKAHLDTTTLDPDCQLQVKPDVRSAGHR
ncbi:MAG: hypothetical protein AAFX39_17080 [Pseudomonadota bacterium]